MRSRLYSDRVHRASGLTRRNTNSWLKVETDQREKPFIPQIFGGDISEMAKTVEMLEDRSDVIDINFGCPAPKVCRNDAGALHYCETQIK